MAAVGIDHADAHAAQLRVAAAGDHGRALGQAGLRCALGADGRNDAAALVDLREDALLQPDGGGDFVVPVAFAQVKDTRCAGVGGLGGEYAGHPVDEPVVEHGAQRGLFVDLGHLVLHPEQAGQRAQRVGLPALAVDGLLKLRIHAHELGNLVVAARIDIGAGPDFVAVLVVEDDALAHTGSGNGGHVMGIDARLLEHAADAAAGQLPVVRPVEIHAAGVARVLRVRPLLLHAAELLAVKAEEHSADAARSRIDGHQCLGHKNLPFQSYGYAVRSVSYII